MARFNGTDSYLLNTASPVTAYPFSVGLWAYWDGATGDRVAWSISSTSGAGYGVALNSSSQWVLFAGTVSTAGITAQANGWTFVLGRFISATNRRISVYHPDGSVAHAQSTTSTTQTVTQTAIGTFYTTSASQVWSGDIAELWYTNSDIFPSGLAATDAFVRHLAHRGPFAHRNVASNIVEYRSLRACLGADEDCGVEVYYGRAGRQTWTKNGGLTLGPHPPLPSTYMRPADFQSVHVI